MYTFFWTFFQFFNFFLWQNSVKTFTWFLQIFCCVKIILVSFYHYYLILNLIFDQHFRISNDELGQWCQSVISLFSLILNEKLQPPETPTNISNGVDRRRKNSRRQSESEKEENNNQNNDTISSGVLLKMMGMTILDIVKLKKNG